VPAKEAMDLICPRHATVTGTAVISDAVTIAGRLSPDDLVVADPPYSDVQYSRFYHVLETIARNERSVVEGRGRYPPLASRPQSDFSKRGMSKNALIDLLSTLSAARSSVIFTFPRGETSNGLSG